MPSKPSKPAPFKPLEAIADFMRRFIAFSDDRHADILALWTLHTWTFDAAYATPYIYVNSAEPQSGKTRVMEVAQLLTRLSQPTSNISTAALFSSIGSSAPTLFMDEVDTVFTGAKNEELRGVLNSGYKAGGVVTRFTGQLGEDGERIISHFPTFCPKMLVGIDNSAMPDTLRDRCIPITLKRKKADQEVERFIPRRVEPEAAALAKQIEQWAAQNIEKLYTVPDPQPIDGISDRSMEIAEPLLLLAAVCGHKYVKPTREAIHGLMAGKQPSLSIGVRTLAAAKEIMDDTGSDRIASSVLAAHMNVSPKRLGNILAAYEITPSTVRFSSGDRSKGYHVADFTDAWERYL
jgi:hypothetical protein